MKKRFLIIAGLIVLLVTCKSPVGGQPDDDDDPNNSHKTAIVFDNTQGICAASVYNDYRRQEDDKITVVSAGGSSEVIEWTPNASAPFYFSYAVNWKGINGFTLNYVPKEIGKDQKAVRIDEGITTTISIPRLEETVSSPDDLFDDKSYLLIQNNSSFPFQLHRGTSIISPDNSSASLVNGGEKALYTINPGAASPYKLLVGADYKEFSSSIVSFEAGRVYSFVFENNNISFITEVELILENVAGISKHIDAPGAPVVTAGDSLITLNWTAVPDAERYEVYYSTTNQRPASPVKTVEVTAYVLTGLANKTVYYFWIRAINSSASSDFSPFSRGIPWPANQVPAVPGTPRIIPGVNQLTVNWDECGGALTYEVYKNTSTVKPSTPDLITTEKGKTSAVIKNLENNQNYYIWLRAVNNVGRSDYSPLVVGTPKIPTQAPDAPSKPVLTAGNHKLTVSWHAVELAASYEIWLGTINDSANAQKQGGDITGGVTETVISGLENEKIYYVWIKAKNIVGTSDFSPSASAKPSAFAVLPDTPSAPSVVAGNRELIVSWPPIEGALSYEVWTGATNNSAYAVKYGADVSGTSTALKGLVNETAYYIWVRAKNNTGTSEFSPRANGTPSAFAVTPSAPQNEPTVIAGNGQLTVSWQAAEGASVYEVWAGTNTNPTLATKRGGDVSGLSSVISGLTNGTTYYVWIKAKNSIGTSGFSPMASETPSVFSAAPQAPSAPSVSIGNGQITVSWAAVAGATTYEVWRGTTNDSASAVKNGADISAALSVTIESLANGTTYYFWIKAKNAAGTSAFSSVASGKPIANASTPALSANNNQLTVTWTAIAGADQYEIFCGSGITPPQTAAKTINAPTTSAAIGDLNNGTTYNVWVRGKNATGTGAMSGAASAKPVGNMGTVTVYSGNNQLTASWTAVFGADQYDVYYSATNTIPGSSSQTVSATTATITGLTNGTTYYVWVKPKNANGAGNTNTAVSGVPMATPGTLTVSTGNRQITVSWAAVTGASSYEFYYSTATTIPDEASFTNVTELNKTITGLSNGTMYNFWVKAVNATGTSGASPMASGKPIGNMGTVTLTTGGSGELVVNWQAAVGADQYEVYYSTTNLIPGSPTQTVLATTATISGLTNGTTYYVWVKGKNANGIGSASTAVNGKPLGMPGTPILSPSFKQLLVTWTAVAGADEYEVYCGTSSNPTTLAATVTGTTTTITGLTNGTTYYVRLRAKNANGISGYGVNANQAPGLTPGLYRGTDKIGTQNLAASIIYISTNAVNGDDFYIVLGVDESSSPITLSYYKTVSITLSVYGGEKNIALNANGALFTVREGVTLTLDGNISLWGRVNNNNPLIYVDGGNLIMNDGAKISDNNNSANIGGVYFTGYGTFTMNGGEISGNTGGVRMRDHGTFTMNGGKISGNTSDYTGGVTMDPGGIFNMTGGEISGNINTKGNGGGVNNSGIFTMTGGEIFGNTCTGNLGSGGGVNVDPSGTFTMSGGVISGNTASYSGGGVAVSSNYTFTKSGGATITGYASDTVNGNVVKNSSGVVQSNRGHAVYVSSSMRRETTAGPTVNLDSNVSGSAGGW